MGGKEGGREGGREGRTSQNAVDPREARDDGGGIQGFELLEAGAVHHPRDHTADVEGLLGVRGDEPAQLARRVERFLKGVWEEEEGGREGGREGG
jgi:hypothetical protein